MITNPHLLSSLITANQAQRLSERLRYVSRSPRVIPILLLLLVTARLMPPDLDGQTVPIARKEILHWLEASDLRISREALRKLLKSLQAARLVELNGSHVRISRPLLDDLRRFGASVHSSPSLPSGASPAATPKGFPDGMPNSGTVFPPGWVSAELDAILKRLQATSGQ